MTPEKQEKLNKHVREIAKVLYSETQPEQRQSFEEIEETIRTQTLQHIAPQLGFFLSNKSPKRKPGESEK